MEEATYKQIKTLWFIYNFNAGLPKEILEKLCGLYEDDWYKRFHRINVSKEDATEIIKVGLSIANKNNKIEKPCIIPKPSERECCANCKYAKYHMKGHWSYTSNFEDEDDFEDIEDYLEYVSKYYIDEYLDWDGCSYWGEKECPYQANSYSAISRVCPHYEPVKNGKKLLCNGYYYISLKEVNDSIKKYIKYIEKVKKEDEELEKRRKEREQQEAKK